MEIKSYLINIQQYSDKSNEFKDSLNDYNAPETLNAEPEIDEVYGTLLDELNGKYERLLSLLQQSLANLADDDADKEVSCVFDLHILYVRIPLSNFVGFIECKFLFACKN